MWGEAWEDREWVLERGRWLGIVGQFEGVGEDNAAVSTEGPGRGGGLRAMPDDAPGCTNFPKTWNSELDAQREKERESLRSEVMHHLSAALEAAESGESGGLTPLSASLLEDCEWGDVRVLGARGVCIRRLAQLEEECSENVLARGGGADEAWSRCYRAYRLYQQAVVCCEDFLSASQDDISPENWLEGWLGSATHGLWVGEEEEGEEVREQWQILRELHLRILQLRLSPVALIETSPSDVLGHLQVILCGHPPHLRDGRPWTYGDECWAICHIRAAEALLAIGEVDQSAVAQPIMQHISCALHHYSAVAAAVNSANSANSANGRGVDGVVQRHEGARARGGGEGEVGCETKLQVSQMFPRGWSKAHRVLGLALLHQALLGLGKSEVGSRGFVRFAAHVARKNRAQQNRLQNTQGVGHGPDRSQGTDSQKCPP
jgi:hypothetical protein